MKNLIFLIILTTAVGITACGGNPETSQIDNENPAMVAQHNKIMPITTSADEAVTEVDNMTTTNQPTKQAAQEIKEKQAAIVDKSMQADMKKGEKKSSAQTQTKTQQKSVVSTATLEKPKPMTTEVENKVRITPNEVEKSTKNTSVNPTATTRETTSPRAVTNDNDMDEKKENTAVAKATKPDHSVWDSILKSNVSASGKVNYAGIKSQKGQLENYVQDLENNPPQSDWSRNEKLAYWINVYNAHTVKLIVDNYPTKSIMDLAGGKAFDKKWINIDGNTYSLNNIENDIIRPRFNESRIHFAVNCAAQSCPPLHNRAWTADNVNATLEQRAKSFINNEKFNEISGNSVTVSKIFDWYGKDFGNLITYLNKYSDTKISSDATVNYKEYDWALNN